MPGTILGIGKLAVSNIPNRKQNKTPPCTYGVYLYRKINQILLISYTLNRERSVKNL